MIKLSKKWCEFLNNQPETGMGYHIVSIVLKNGEKYDKIIIDSGYITKIKDLQKVPFKVEDIIEIIVTPDKWNFRKE